ncbi:MAG TPA: dTDP-4-dehydrorhamnose 3,5-epimerase [Oryzihumus sp.]|nr:dTDP-4-dehydrorhamnose 3,5-epimerase [Oryzihumus sp.]
MSDIRPLRVEGAFVSRPQQFHDDRGVFLESFRADRLAEAIGHEMRILQTNVSVSSRGTVRGIHFADVPPSQAKYVTALSGSFIDFVVDIREGSPTFGQWDSVLLDTEDRQAIYIGEGLGHALCALEDNSTVMYLCSATYAPGREHGITPLDPEVGLQFPEGLEPLLSAKDAAAPTLAEARERGLLPRYEDCRRYYAELAQR